MMWLLYYIGSLDYGLVVAYMLIGYIYATFVHFYILF